MTRGYSPPGFHYVVGVMAKVNHFDTSEAGVEFSAFTVCIERKDEADRTEVLKLYFDGVGHRERLDKLVAAINAIMQEVVGDEEKYGCLKREILGECL